MRTVGRVGLAAAVFVLALAGSARAQDVSGRWDLSVSTPDGVYPAVLNVTRSGEALTGTIAGSPGEFPVKGTQRGTDVVVSFTMPQDDGPMLITLKGTQSGDAMKGTATFGADGEGTWTGTRGAAAASAPGAASLTGSWTLEVTTGMGSGTPSMVLKQDGDTVTGSYTGQLGQAPVTGTIKGNDFTLSFDITVQDTALHVVYAGALEGGTMSGKVSLGDLGEGTFKGRRAANP